jgi:basic membrane protein A and related proteins
MSQARGTRRSAAIAGLAVLAASLVLVACGSSSKDEGNGAASSGGGGVKKLGLMMDVQRNDKGFGSATYAGVQKAAKDFKLKLSVVDGLAGKPKDAQSALNNLARDSHFVIDGASATNSVLPRVAARNAGKQFAVYAVPVPSSKNLHYAYQDWYPLGYMAGVVAAKATKTKTIGFVGGGLIPPTIRGQAGYIAGAKATDPSVKVVKTIAGDFDDAAKGKNATAAQISQNADVIYSFLDAGHAGAVQAVKQSGKKVALLGVIIPKCSFSDGFELGDTVANQGQLVYDLVKGMVHGNLKDTVFGVQDPEVADFKFCPGKGGKSMTAAVDKVRQQFTSGELKSPK